MKYGMILVALLFSVDAFAANPPSKFAVCANNTTGVVQAKPKCTKAETALNLAALLGTINNAAASATFIPGPVDPNTCTTRTSEYNATSLGSAVSIYCEPGEFLMTHGVETDDSKVDINQIRLQFYDGLPFPVGVRYHMIRDQAGTNFSVVVRAFCCRFA